MSKELSNIKNRVVVVFFDDKGDSHTFAFDGNEFSVTSDVFDLATEWFNQLKKLNG